MVTKILVDHDIEAGRLLITELDRAQVPVAAAFWLYQTEDDRYQLVIATELYDVGPLDAYRIVHDALDRIPDVNRLALTDLNVVSVSNPIAQAIRALKMRKTESNGKGVRITRSTVGGVYFEDAWVYRSA